MGKSPGGQLKREAVCSGKTEAGSTNWQKYNDMIYVNVDTSACDFTSTPAYISSMHGNHHHWTSTGSSEVYQATATGFRIYIHQEGGITPETANSFKWHIVW